MSNSKVIPLFSEIFLKEKEKEKEENLKTLLNQSMDKLHKALLKIPREDAEGLTPVIRKEVLLALHHVSWSLNYIEEEEETNRGSGR